MDKDRQDKFSDTVDAETMKHLQNAVKEGKLKPTRNIKKDNDKGNE